MHQKQDWIGLYTVLRPRQHSVGYMGDNFLTGQKTQTTSKAGMTGTVHDWTSQF